MEEFKKGSSKPERKVTIEEEIQKKIKSGLIYKRDGIVLKNARLENIVVLDLQEGEFIASDSVSLQNWNCLFKGEGRIIVPNNDDTITTFAKFEGYAEVKDGKCEKVNKVILIKK